LALALRGETAHANTFEAIGRFDGSVRTMRVAAPMARERLVLLVQAFAAATSTKLRSASTARTR
jgi:hypothetical protein